MPRYFAVRDGLWKLIMDHDENPSELYNLASDRAEANNLIEDPGQASRIARMVDLLLDLHSAARTAPVTTRP